MTHHRHPQCEHNTRLSTLYECPAGYDTWSQCNAGRYTKDIKILKTPLRCERCQKDEEAKVRRFFDQRRARVADIIAKAKEMMHDASKEYGAILAKAMREEEIWVEVERHSVYVSELEGLMEVCEKQVGNLDEEENIRLIELGMGQEA